MSKFGGYWVVSTPPFPTQINSQQLASLEKDHTRLQTKYDELQAIYQAEHANATESLAALKAEVWPTPYLVPPPPPLRTPPRHAALTLSRFPILLHPIRTASVGEDVIIGMGMICRFSGCLLFLCFAFCLPVLNVCFKHSTYPCPLDASVILV